MRRAIIFAGLAALAAVVPGVADSAGNTSVVGEWKTQEGHASSYYYPGASDVQTMDLDAGGAYKREIVVEGSDGYTQYTGKIIDVGTYQFTAPESFHYKRQSWTLCTMVAGCAPSTPLGPDEATITFKMLGQNRAEFIGLVWTKVR